MRPRATTFIIAQRVSTVLTADTIVVLDEGRIVAKGRHDELVVRSPVYQEIFESQLGSAGGDSEPNPSAEAPKVLEAGEALS